MKFNILGIHHLKLTVSNLERSKRFYQKFPVFKIVAEYPGFVMFFNGHFYLGLTDHKGKVKKSRFSEFEAGLDHVSFTVESKNDLLDAIKFFDKEKIPHGKIERLSNNLNVLAFRDPDNIQLELSWRKK